jgi:fermentation-respiration switch protein FrsA (DUF1100 family)
MARSRVRSLVQWTVGASLVTAIGLAGGVIAGGLYLSAPAYAVIGPPPRDLPAEPVTLSSASGATLRGWFISGRSGAGAMVLLHGVGANRRSMVPRARLLHAAGFSVLLFDFQAHGESTGDRISFGRREALDARSAVAYLRQRLPNEHIGAIGTSLGGAATLLGPGPLDVNALVLESVYAEIDLAIANRLRVVGGAYLGAAVAQPVARLFEILLPPLLDVRETDLRPIDHIAEATAPILLASGTDDTRTTITEAMALFRRAREPKTFWAVEGAGHVDLERFAPDEYRRRVLPFLMERLQAH